MEILVFIILLSVSLAIYFVWFHLYISKELDEAKKIMKDLKEEKARYDAQRNR